MCILVRFWRWRMLYGKIKAAIAAGSFWGYYNTTIPLVRLGSLALLPFGSLALLPFGSLALLPFGSLALLPFEYALSLTSSARTRQVLLCPWLHISQSSSHISFVV
jgi:hypothetical protein